MKMLSEQIIKTIASDIDNVLEKNADMLTQEFASCFDPDDIVDPAIAKMIVKAMRFSTQLSLQLTLNYLEDMHIIKLPPDGTPLVYLADKENAESG